MKFDVCRVCFRKNKVQTTMCATGGVEIRVKFNDKTDFSTRLIVIEYSYKTKRFYVS